MQKKTIYLIRHGQTDFNKRGIVQGSRVDSDLNDEGREQAQKFYNFYQAVRFDKIYTSKLKRTTQSVQGFIDKNIPTEALLGLNEISWGDQDGKASNADMHEYYNFTAKEWASGNLDLEIGGGESPNEVAQRQKEAIKTIFENTDSEKTILICMHGRAMRILLCTLLGKSLTQMDTFAHSNLCLYKLIQTNNKFEIELSNDIRHLQ